MFKARFVNSALEDLEFLEKFEQRHVVSMIQQHLSVEPAREFLIAEIDDFDEEIEALSRNPEFLELLEERSKEKAKGGYSLEEVKRRLGLD